MNLKRVFLGWDEPLICKATQFLAEKYQLEGYLDLSSITCVLPGKRAGRRLLNQLTILAEKNSLKVIPPLIITVGNLPEFISNSDINIDDSLFRQSIWLKVLESTDTTLLKELFPAFLNSQSFSKRFEMSRYLDGLREEFASANRSLSEALNCVQIESAITRWQILAQLEAKYIEILTSLNLEDRYSKRSKLLSESFELKNEIVLIGLIDLNVVAKAYIEKCSSKVTVLVAAPENYKNHFDKFGCVDKEAWLKEEIEIPSQRLNVVADPKSEGRQIVQTLSKLGKNFGLEDITLGVVDESLLSTYKETLLESKIELRQAVGKSFITTSLVVLFQTLIEYLNVPTVSTFGGLIRHPLIERYCQQLISKDQHSSIIKALDAFQNEHLQLNIADLVMDNNSLDAQIVDVLVKAIKDLVKPLMTEKKPITAWQNPFTEVISKLFPNEVNGIKDAETVEVLSAVAASFTKASEIPSSLEVQVTFTEALGFVINELSTLNLNPEIIPDSLETIGWLELLHDDGSAVVISGFHNNAIPKAVNEDPLLPDSLRKQLGLSHNDSRFVRDAYLIKYLLQSHAEIYFSVSKKDALGNPVLPSRLLFIGAKETLPERILSVFGTGEILAAPNRTSSELDLTWLKNFYPPTDLPVIKTISVTGFRDYLVCPYRFYLSRILKLRESTDQIHELDALNFGTLIHEVLANFAESEARHSTKSEEILSATAQILDNLFAKQFGTNALPAVYVQKEIIKELLKQWSINQASWANEGWRIQDSEVAIKPGILKLNGDVSVVGRIDRIDKNINTNEWALIDYKTGQSSKSPDDANKTKKGWVDLQLPLYYYAAIELGLSKDIRLCYCNLSASHDDSGFEVASWSETELGQAWDLANALSVKISNFEFWPPAKISENWEDPLQAIVDHAQLFEITSEESVAK